MPNADRDKGFDAQLADPSRHFPKPMDVVRAGSLSRAQKVKLLDAMEHNAHELLTATAENMGGGEPSVLDDVLDAKRHLAGEA